MKKSRLLVAVGACLFSFITMPSHATLIDQGDGTVFDSDLNIYWLKNANLADTNPFGLSVSDKVEDKTPNTVGSSGYMTWDNAIAWIAGMNVFDNDNGYLGYNDWRLPTALNQDGTAPCGVAFNCTGSEMGHLFYSEFGATANSSVWTTGNATELAKFTNIQSFYWSGTEFDSSVAWGFHFLTGSQFPAGKSDVGSVWAVRDVSAIPEPPILYLLVPGLLGLVGMARRKAA